uniref:WAC domain-containing protein n=1 Tax=Macrostomum lignano TaxID=282301 RepID=A0A1I8HAX9_9PLAT
MPLLGSRPHVLNQLVKKERKRPSTAQTSTAPPPDSPTKSGQQQHEFVADITQEICSSAGELERKNRIYAEPIWTCRCTGRSCLSYKDAVKSEKSCQRLLKKLFPKYYVQAALEIVHHSTDTIDNAVNRVYRKLHQEFYLDEPVCLKNKVRDKIIKGTIYRKDEPAVPQATSPSASSAGAESASNTSATAAANASTASNSNQNGCSGSATASPAKDEAGASAVGATSADKKSESPGQDKENKNKSPPQKVTLLPFTYAIQLDDDEHQVISRVPASAIVRETRMPSKENIRLFIRASALRYGSNNTGPWIVDEDLVKKYRLRPKIADLVLDKHQVMLNSVESEIDALRKLDGLPVARKSGGANAAPIANGDTAGASSSKKRKDAARSSAAAGAGGKKMKQMTLFDLKGKSPFKVMSGGATVSGSKTPSSRALQQLPPIGLKLVRAVKMERSEQMIKVLLNKCAQVLTERQVTALPMAVRERLRAVQARLNERKRIEAMTPEQREEYKKAKREEAKLKAKMTLDAKKRRFEDSLLLSAQTKSLPTAKPIELPPDFPPSELGRAAMLAEFMCAYRPLLAPSVASGPNSVAASANDDVAGVVATVGDENIPLSVDNLLAALVSKEPSGYAYLSKLLTMLLRALLQDENIAGGRRELGTLLTDMPVSEYTAAEMARVLLAPRKRSEEAKNDRLKLEKAKRKTEKAQAAAANGSTSTGASTSKAGGGDDSTKPPVAASVKMSSRLIALAEQAREREVREKAERQRRAQETEWARIDSAIAAADREYERAMSDSRAATRVRPLGRDRGHARYWHLRCAPGRLLIETGWAAGGSSGDEAVPASSGKSPDKQRKQQQQSPSKLNTDAKPSTSSKPDSAQEDDCEELTWPTEDDSAPNVWRQLNSETELDELLTSLLPTGVRESALHREVDRVSARLRREIKHRSAAVTTEASLATASGDSLSAIANLRSVFAEELARTEAGLSQGGLGGVPNPAKLKKMLDQCDSASISQMANCMLLVEKHVLDRFRYGAFKDPEFCEQWRASVSACTTWGRLNFLLSVLDSSVNWDKSTANAKCQVCRVRRDPPNLLLCEKCNRAFHPDCLRPRLTERPTGDWYCLACAPAGAASSTGSKKSSTSRRRERRSRRFYDEDDVDDDADNDEDDDGMGADDDERACCQVCDHSAHAGAPLIQCVQCRSNYHAGCHEPPLRSNTRSAFRCAVCRKGRKSVSKNAGINGGSGKRGRPRSAGGAAKKSAAVNGKRSPQSRSKKAALSEDEFDNDEEEEAETADEEDEGNEAEHEANEETEEEEELEDDDDEEEEAAPDNSSDDEGMEVDDQQDDEDEEEESGSDDAEEEAVAAKSRSKQRSSTSSGLKTQKASKKSGAAAPPAKRGRKSTSSVASESNRRGSKKQQPAVSNRRHSLASASAAAASSKQKISKRSSKTAADSEDEDQQLEQEAEEEKVRGKRVRYSSGGAKQPPGKRARLAPDQQEQQQRLCKALLDKIYRHKDAWPFVDPVDPKDAPDYYQIVSKPICLLDMRKRQQRGGYANADQMMSDFALLFGNATEYNPANSEELNCALRLEQQLAKLLNQHDLIGRYPRRSFYI